MSRFLGVIETPDFTGNADYVTSIFDLHDLLTVVEFGSYDCVVFRFLHIDLAPGAVVYFKRELDKNKWLNATQFNSTHHVPRYLKTW